MIASPRTHGSSRRPRAVLALAVVILMASAGPEAFAGAGRVRTGDTATGLPLGHGCQCEAVCRGNCCCARRKANSAPSSPAGRNAAGPSPCIAAAPCGEPGLPVPSPNTRIVKSAALAVAAPPIPDSAGVPILGGSPAPVPSRVDEPADEPPESPHPRLS